MRRQQRAGGEVMGDLDPVIHAQARLRIVSTLATLDAGESISFPRAMELLDITPGNLSTHLRKLEVAGYVTVTKAHQGRMPVTWLELSQAGRRAFEDHTHDLRVLLEGRP